MHSVAGRSMRRLEFEKRIEWQAAAYTAEADASGRSRSQLCP